MSKQSFFLALPENKTELMNFIFWALVSFALFTWFRLQLPLQMTADTLWMAESAVRMLQGEKFSEAYYDPNPPLSMILYIPAVLAAQTGLVNMHTALFLYTLLHLGGAAFALYRLIGAIPGYDRSMATVTTLAFILAGTVMAGNSFTERDQIIGFWLVPFVLVQLCMTKGWAVPRGVKHVTLLLGAFMMLVKPHYGLIPTLMILHRVFVQKRITVFKDADFIYLAAGVLSYAALLWFYFPDFLSVVLPDIVALYPVDNTKFVLYRAAYNGLIAVCALLLTFIAGRISWLPYFFFGMALLALVPFVAQMRGYHYQMLPAITFFFCGAALLGREWLSRYMSPLLAVMVAVFALGAIAFISTPSRPYTVKAAQYPQLPLARALEGCTEPCSFMVANNHIEITHQTALYTGKHWASRFPSPWFVPALYDLEKKDHAKFLTLRAKYAGMMAEDLNRYKPQIIMFAEFPLTAAQEFDLLGLFAGESAFQQALSAYQPQPDVTIAQSAYFPRSGIFRDKNIRYRVFRRKNP